MQEQLPDTITNDLIIKLSQYGMDNRLTELESKRFLKNAKTLEKSHPSEFFMLSGVVHSLMGNYSKTISNFDKALNYSIDDYEPILLNYAVAFKNLGKFDQAFQIIDENYYDGSVNLTKEALLTALNIGLFNKAKFYSDKLNTLNTKNKFDNSPYIEKILNSCKKLKIELVDLPKIYNVVLGAIHKNNKSPIDNKNLMSEESDSLLLLFKVNAESKTLSKISIDIADEFAVQDIPAIINNTVTPIVLKGSEK